MNPTMTAILPQLLSAVGGLGLNLGGGGGQPSAPAMPPETRASIIGGTLQNPQAAGAPAGGKVDNVLGSMIPAFIGGQGIKAGYNALFGKKAEGGE
jgi:hypothetical protein